MARHECADFASRYVSRLSHEHPVFVNRVPAFFNSKNQFTVSTSENATSGPPSRAQRVQLKLNAY